MSKTDKQIVIDNLDIMSYENNFGIKCLNVIRDFLNNIPENCNLFKSIAKKLSSIEDREAALHVITIFYYLNTNFGTVQ